MKVYLDTGCLGRLTDDQSQPGIREEAEAVERILTLVQNGAAEWVASEALLDEVCRNPSVERRLEGEALLTLASEAIEIGAGIGRRAKRLASAGYGAYDALHLAAAESAGADVLLSTDDRCIKRVARGAGHPRVPVRNPVSWLQEQRS